MSHAPPAPVWRVLSLVILTLGLMYGATFLVVLSLAAACLSLRGANGNTPRSFLLISLAGFSFGWLAYGALGQTGQSSLIPAPILAAIVFALSVGILFIPGRWGLVVALVAVPVFVALAIGRSWSFEAKIIDTVTDNQIGTQALLHGENPYATEVPLEVYGADGGYHVEYKRYPYQPGVPIVAAPVTFVFGDFRIASIAMGEFIVLSLYKASTVGRRPEVLALATVSPLLPIMTLNAWVDVETMACFTLWFVLRQQFPRLAPVILGVGLATKPILYPALLVLAWKLPDTRKQLVGGALVAVAIVAGFAIWTGIGVYFDQTVWRLVDTVTRYDALTLNALLHLLGMRDVPGFVALLAIVLGGIIVVRWTRPTSAETLASGATVLLLAFLFARQAFLNFYYVPAVLILLAVAEERADEPSPAAAIER